MVRVYLDSSALLKLVHTETETAALRRYLGRHRTDQHVTSALARTEVVRAAISAGPGAVTVARSVLTGLFHIDVNRPVLDAAGVLHTQPVLRTLDAIHVASALTLRSDLRSLVTYDKRMAAAAEALGLPVVAPV